MSVISINSATADATLRFSDAAPAPPSLVSTAPTASSVPSSDTDSLVNNKNNNTKPALEPAATRAACAADMGPDFVMRGVSFADAAPASLADLFALSPFAASTAASSPSDSLDSERDYYVALRDARKQLAAKLRGALRDLREERAVKSGLLRKRYQMRNRNHAAGVAAKPAAPNQTCAQQAHAQQQRAARSLQTLDAASFSAAAPAASSATGGATAKPPPPKICAKAVAMRIGANAVGGSGSVVKCVGAKAVPQERWYGDDVRMCSSPVSEEFEVELVEEEGGTHPDDVVGSECVSMAAPECRI